MRSPSLDPAFSAKASLITNSKQLEYVDRRISEDEDAKVAFRALSQQLQHANTGLDITLQKLGMQSGEDRHRLLAECATELGYVCDVLRRALPYLTKKYKSTGMKVAKAEILDEVKAFNPFSKLFKLPSSSESCPAVEKMIQQLEKTLGEELAKMESVNGAVDGNGQNMKDNA